jgi:DNA-binding CsgD family transcriptional regulator
LSVAGQEALLRLVAACSRGEEANGTLRVPRPAPALPLTIVALPLRDLQRGPVAAGISAGGEPAALLLISDPELRQAARREDLIQRFGLTRAEADFALEIVKGDGKRAAAARRGISYATARTHLSRIFEKTGTRRQAELVHRLLAIERGAANDAFSQPGPLL